MAIQKTTVPKSLYKNKNENKKLVKKNIKKNCLCKLDLGRDNKIKGKLKAII